MCSKLILGSDLTTISFSPLKYATAGIIRTTARTTSLDPFTGTELLSNPRMMLSSSQISVCLSLLMFISERFSLRTYEYHETNQSIRDGYIFALFSMKNATRDVLINELDNPESLMDLKESCLDELKNLKIKKNIG